MLLWRLGSPGLRHDSDAVHPRYQLLALLAQRCFSRVTSASGRHNNVGACEGHQWTKKLAIPLRRVHAAPDRQNPKGVSSRVPWSSSQGDHATQGRPPRKALRRTHLFIAKRREGWKAFVTAKPPPPLPRSMDVVVTHARASL